MRWEGVMEPKPGPSGLQSCREASEMDGQSETETPDALSQKSPNPLKIHVTALPKGKVLCGKKKKGLRVDDRTQVTYSRGSNKQDTPAATASVASSNEVGPLKANTGVKRKSSETEPPMANTGKKQKTANNLDGISGVELMLTQEDGTLAKKLSPEKEEARQQSDNLLFQRMLSIFYWPAMMTLMDPPQLRVRQLAGMVAKANENTEKNAKTSGQDKYRKSMLTKDDLDIEVVFLILRSCFIFLC